MQQYTSHSLEETLSIARKLGRSLKPGTVVAYLGELMRYISKCTKSVGWP